MACLNVTSILVRLFVKVAAIVLGVVGVVLLVGAKLATDPGRERIGLILLYTAGGLTILDLVLWALQAAGVYKLWTQLESTPSIPP